MNAITPAPSDLHAATRLAAGHAADHAAARHAFADFAQRKARNTLRAHRADLDTFATYLNAVTGEAMTGAALQSTPEPWAWATWGLVAGFVQWQLRRGDAAASVSRRLSTVKVYAALAAQAGAIAPNALALIRTVQSYAGKEGKRMDERRAEAGTPVRRGRKKAAAVTISAEQAAALKAQPDTPQGRRDALLMCLLLDHGLRVSETAVLQVADFDTAKGVFTFYRPKVDLTQTHKMTSDTLRAGRRWLDTGDCPPMGLLLRSSRKGGALTGDGMTTAAINARVGVLGAAVGLERLSPHDCRHFWATAWAGKVDVLRLQEAGGWNSLAMPRRYVERARIANEGMA